jgi:predicted Rossmann fold nucleotide-binding protein DprA/Smf involved in DNA uptake
VNDPASLPALLAWMAVPGVGDRALAAILEHARAARQPLAVVWATAAAGPADFARLVPLQPRSVAALAGGAVDLLAGARSLAVEASRSGVEALTADDPAYPAPLRALPAGGARRWPVLFAFGLPDLLEEPLVAIVNSRGPAPGAIAWTNRLADALARRDVALAAGLNREAYQAVAVGAKRHGGATALVMDRGMLSAFPAGPGREPVPAARVWDESLDPETQLLLSPFGLRDEWTPRSGPRRDGLVCDLAGALVAVDVRSGGRMEAECRRAAARGVPVFVLDHAEELAAGSRALLESVPTARRLGPGGTADALAAQVAAALPGRDLALRHGTGAERAVRDFLIAAAHGLHPGDPPDAAAVFPGRGELARRAATSTLRAAMARGEGAGSLDLALAEGLPPARLPELAARLRAGGLLLATLPASWLREPGQPDRARLLHAGQVVAVVELPVVERSPRTPAPAEPAVVMVYRRGARDESAARLLAPEEVVATGHQLRRYLGRALELLAGPPSAAAGK